MSIESGRISPGDILRAREMVGNSPGKSRERDPDADGTPRDRPLQLAKEFLADIDPALQEVLGVAPRLGALTREGGAILPSGEAPASFGLLNAGQEPAPEIPGPAAQDEHVWARDVHGAGGQA